jgi:hypothetical protein
MYVFSVRVEFPVAEKDDFGLYVSEGIPQRPSSADRLRHG